MLQNLCISETATNEIGGKLDAFLWQGTNRLIRVEMLAVVGNDISALARAQVELAYLKAQICGQETSELELTCVG